MLETGGRRLIIDAGPDFRYQMLRMGVADVRAILLTHAHKDHTGGLDDVRAFNWVKQGPVDIYCDAVTESAIRKDYDYCFAEMRYPGIPEIELHPIGDKPFFIDDICITPVRVMHHRLPVTAFRIGRFAYVTDVSEIPLTSLQQLQGVEILVIGALRKEPHLSHFSLQQALEVIENLHVKQAYITHIGHQMGLAAEVSVELPSHVALSYDGLFFEV